MPGKQAKILSLGDVNDLLVFASCTRHPVRNPVIVLLAAKAGLRAGEVANLTWDMVLDPTGDVGSVIELRDIAAKNGSGRLIPVHWIFGTPSPPIAVSRPTSDLSFDLNAAVRRRSVWWSGSIAHSATLVSTAARHTPDAGRSLPARPGSCTRPVARCATFSCLPVIARSKPRNGTSTGALTSTRVTAEH